MLPYFDNTKILKECYELTLEDISQFLSLLHRQEISHFKHGQYCKFGDSNEIMGSGMDRFFLIGKLIREGYLLSKMRGYICTVRNEPKEFKAFMKSLEIKKGISLLRISKEYDTLYLFSEPYFSNFMSLVDVGDDFDMEIKTMPFFVETILDYISQSKKIDTGMIELMKKNLFLDINSYLQGKRNYGEKITLKYNIDDYIENKSQLYPFIKELEEKKKLKIHNLVIMNESISFVIDSFMDFEESIFIEKKEEKTIFLEPYFNKEEGILFAGEKNIKFSKGTLIYHMIDTSYSKGLKEEILYENVFDKIDTNIGVKEITKKGSDCISSYNKKIEQQLGIKEFFGRGKELYYRNY